MKYNLTLLFTLLLAVQALAQSGAPYATAPTPIRHAEAIPQARKIVMDYLAAGAPGVAVAVGVDGTIVWSEGFGLADIEQRVPVTPATKFRIGSVSKPLTAAAVGLLHEEGRLDIDAPVQRYVPSFPVKKHEITTRLLAGHLAGIRHYRAAENYSARHYPTVVEGLDIFKNDPLLHPPGTKYAYSSYGWNLISAVVEGASGTDFLTYMRTNVLEPLGMRNTVA
ncbi:MAG: beta-lactamase family protein, partial [bacterium]|nr:beta-lactamase family protein [bacterium]